MIVTVFRARLRPDLNADVLSQLATRGARMYELASAMPGFISYKDFSAADGESVSIVEFETEAQVRAWRDQPEHLAVQAWSRDVVFSEYQIQVCALLRVSRFAEGRAS
jgi:heme-degrading monooxygenase HmoA